MKRLGLIAMMVFVAFIFQGGCEGLLVKESDTQYGASPYQKEMSQPTTEVKKQLIAEKLEIVSQIPEGNYSKLKLGAKPVSPLARNTVIKLQSQMGQSGLAIFVNQKELLIETQAGDGKRYRGWVEPGTIFLAELKEESANGIKEYRLVRIALCQNPVQGVAIRLYPAIEKITEQSRQTVTERYRDIRTKIDYTSALWAGIAGLLIGGIIGGFWLKKEKAVGAKKESSSQTS